MVELPTATFLKAESIDHEAVGEIIDEGEIRAPEETGFDDPVFEIGVKVGVVKFKWTMNAKSQRNLISKWGNDTKTWIGKKIILWKVKQQAWGREIDVIYAKAAAETPATTIVPGGQA